MDPQDFFRTLWGDPPPGVINIFRLPDRASSWHRIIPGINELLSRYEHEEVYTGVSLADQQKGRFTTRNRIEEAAAGAIAGVWADIDVFHPVHTKAERLPGTREEAMEVMSKLRYEPTLIIDSGHGLQYWWLLHHPWVFQDETEWGEARRMVQWWHHETKELFDARGWTTDSVYDLSRILRIPGTYNNKVPEDRKRVVAVKTGGPRYDREDFLRLGPEEFVATAPAPEQRRGRKGRAAYEASATASGLILDPKAEPNAVRLAALLKADKKFQRSWDRDRPDLDDQSPSSYNMSLADIAVRAGWPDQEVVNLLICWRRMHGFDLKLRERYYELTLARAKEPIEMKREQRRLEETLADPPEDEAEVYRDSLARLFKVDIIRIVKYLGDPPEFFMQTEQGDITIGPISNVYSQPKFREAVGAATSVVIPKVSGAVWETRIQAILSSAEDVDVGEASHPVEETKGWVHDYLIERYVRSEEEWEKGAQQRRPYMTDGHIHIFMNDILHWMDVTLNQKLDKSKMGQRLRRIGSTTHRVHVNFGGARTTRSVWALPEEFQPPDEGEGQPEGDPEDQGEGPDGGVDNAPRGPKAGVDNGVDNGPASTAEGGIHEGEDAP